MLYDKEQSWKRKNKRDEQSKINEKLMDSGGFVRIIQPGPYYGKTGIILRQLEASDRWNWFLIDVEGQEVGFPEGMLEMGVSK